MTRTPARHQPRRNLADQVRAVPGVQFDVERPQHHQVEEILGEVLGENVAYHGHVRQPVQTADRSGPQGAFGGDQMMAAAGEQAGERTHTGRGNRRRSAPAGALPSAARPDAPRCCRSAAPTSARRWPSRHLPSRRSPDVARYAGDPVAGGGRRFRSSQRCCASVGAGTRGHSKPPDRSADHTVLSVRSSPLSVTFARTGTQRRSPAWRIVVGSLQRPVAALVGTSVRPR